MKTSVLAVAVLWVGAAIAQAPDPSAGESRPRGRQESPAQRLEHLATLLDLTAAQKPQVETILEEQRKKMRQQREQARASGQRPTFEQMKAAHEQAQQETLAKLTPVLTPAQLEKFQVLMEHRGPTGGPH